MQKKSEKILELLTGGKILKAARLEPLRVTKEIQGFGSCIMSPPSSSSSGSSRTSSFGSYSTWSCAWNEIEHELNKHEPQSPAKGALGSYAYGGIYEDDEPAVFLQSNETFAAVHIWDCSSSQERGSLLLASDSEEEDDDVRKDGFINGICSKLLGVSPLRARSGES